MPGQAVPSREQLAQDDIDDAKVSEEIETAKRLLAKLDDASPHLAEFLFQLSGLYWEKFCILERRELASAGVDAKPDHRESALYKSEVMRLYETILARYPAYGRSDEILFNLAYNLSFIGKTDQALRRYSELIRKYPSSVFVPDAYLQIGNHLYKEGKFEKARRAVEQVLFSSDQRRKARALLLLAWCDFSSGEGERALKKVEEVVTLCALNEGHQPLDDLRNEALRDFATISVKLGRVEEARAYLKANAPEPELTSLMNQLDKAPGR